MPLLSTTDKTVDFHRRCSQEVFLRVVLTDVPLTVGHQDSTLAVVRNRFGIRTFDEDVLRVLATGREVTKT